MHSDCLLSAVAYEDHRGAIGERQRCNVQDDEVEVIAAGLSPTSGTRVSDSSPPYQGTDHDPILSSGVPLPDSWRVLKTRKDSDSHPPLLPGGGLPVCTGPSSEIRIGKRKEKQGKRSEVGMLSFVRDEISTAKAIHNL
jgi:hypothetical protein